MPASKRTSTGTRTGIPRVTSLTIDEERLAHMWRMSADERRAAAQRGEFSLGEMLKWAARRPAEVPIVNGEFFFITAQSEDAAYCPSEDL